MNEVEEVARAICAWWGWDKDAPPKDVLEDGVELARAAIAALDACRRNPTRIIDALRAREVGRKAGYEEGREAGLREAAAVVRSHKDTQTAVQWDWTKTTGNVVADDILALIDKTKS